MLFEDVEDGNEICVTAKSIKDAFNDVEATAVITGNYGTAEIGIVALGGIKASFSSTDNSAVVAMLYDNKGVYVNKYNYNGTTLTIDGLKDGDYTLVSMGSSNFFNSVLHLEQLEKLGLAERKDFVKNYVSVRSGTVSVVSVIAIPLLDESRFYYTGDNTSFTVNKNSVTSGNYVTLRANVDFKQAYASNISDVTIAVDLPENIAFVDNSVMLGNSIASYVKEDNRIYIPLSSSNPVVRFCVIPTAAGEYSPTAYVMLKLDGKDITQPIGSADFTVKDLDIFVPKCVAKKEFVVTGSAFANSEVTVYDGNVAIGQTKALANGTWKAWCELVDPYNLSNHEIMAKVETTNGMVLQSETKQLHYDINAIEVSKVTMINTAHAASSLKPCEYVSIFDFQNPDSHTEPYWYWPDYPDFTFLIEFTNNSPEKVSNVELYVHTSSKEIVKLRPEYNEKQDKWIATSKFYSNSLPVNVSLDYDGNSQPLIDVDAWNISQNLLTDYLSDIELSTDKTDVIMNELLEEYSKDVPENSRINVLEEKIIEYYNVEYIDVSNIATSEESVRSYLMPYSDALDSIDIIARNLSKYEILSISKELEKYMKGINITDCSELDSLTLLLEGYERIVLTDNSVVYELIDEKKHVFVDFKNNLKIEIIITLASSKVLKLAQSKSDEFICKIRNFLTETGEILDQIQAAGELIEDFIDQFNNVFGFIYGRAKDGFQRNLSIIKELSKNRQNGNVFPGQRIVEHEFIDKCRQHGNLMIQSQQGLVILRKYKKGIDIGKQVLGYISIISHFRSAINEVNVLANIYESIPEPCEKDQMRADVLKDEIRLFGLETMAYYGLQITSCLISIQSAAASAAALMPTAGVSAASLLGSLAVMAANIWAGNRYGKTVELRVSEFKTRKNGLICTIISDDGNVEICGNCGGSTGGRHHSGNKDKVYVQDPSGFVYEGVETNRLEGVKATCYYKEEVEDMYGDNHEYEVLWNAEEYAQENPLFTDKNGMYAWDVPQGLWQVRFEKEGYEPMQSEWLPVPPPQLEVNIPMTQLVQPQIVKAAAYEEAVEFSFDKYMDASTLTTGNISATSVNGIKIEGHIVLKDADEADGKTLARTVRFEIDDTNFTGSTVTLSVKNKVKSYAGIQMAENFSQEFDIIKEMKTLAVDSIINVVYGDSVKVLVGVLPAEASKGKTVNLRTTSPMISWVTAEAQLDENGQTEVWLTGELPGSVQLMIGVDDSDMKGESKVNVVPELVLPYAPKANRISGTAVYRGTVITLSCDTENTTIYYTTDGSCPCDAGAIKYDGSPIMVNEAMTIKAMSVNNSTKTESEVITFTYTIRKSMASALSEGWNWTSHNSGEDVDAKLYYDFADRVQSQTKEFIRDPKFGIVGNLNTISATEGVKVYTSEPAVAAGAEYYAINPREADINLVRGWNWIGYPVEQEQSLEEALVYLPANEGDVIVAQNGFATFTGEKWMGSLNTLVPGLGYLYKSAAHNSFYYADNTVSTARIHYAKVVKRQDEWKVADVHKYPNQMSMIAVLEDADAADYAIGAFDTDGECRGIAKEIDGKLFLSVCGNGGEEIRFIAMNRESGEETELGGRTKFVADVVGSLGAPYILMMSDPSGIRDIDAGNGDRNAKVYDLTGRRVNVVNKRGIYIRQGRKVMVK